MAGTKRAFTLEWVSDDGASFAAKDEERRRTMGRSTKTIHDQVGDKVFI